MRMVSGDGRHGVRLKGGRMSRWEFNIKVIDVHQGMPLNFDIPAMRIECCKCGFTHIVTLEEINGEPMLHFYVDDEATKLANKRRRKEKK